MQANFAVQKKLERVPSEKKTQAMDGVRVQLPGMLKNTRVLIQNFMEWELKVV